MAVSKGPITKQSNQIRRSAADIAEAASQAAKEAQESAEDLMASTRGRADQISSAAGETLQSAAKTVRRYAPREGRLASAGTAVADRLEGAGQYLEEGNIAAIAGDLADVIRRHPVQSLLIAASVGFFIGRMRK